MSDTQIGVLKSVKHCLTDSFINLVKHKQALCDQKQENTYLLQVNYRPATFSSPLARGGTLLVQRHGLYLLLPFYPLPATFCSLLFENTLVFIAFTRNNIVRLHVATFCMLFYFNIAVWIFLQPFYTNYIQLKKNYNILKASAWHFKHL